MIRRKKNNTMLQSDTLDFDGLFWKR